MLLKMSMMWVVLACLLGAAAAQGNLPACAVSTYVYEAVCLLIIDRNLVSNPLPQLKGLAPTLTLDAFAVMLATSMFWRAVFLRVAMNKTSKASLWMSEYRPSPLELIWRQLLKHLIKRSAPALTSLYPVF